MVFTLNSILKTSLLPSLTFLNSCSNFAAKYFPVSLLLYVSVSIILLQFPDAGFFYCLLHKLCANSGLKRKCTTRVGGGGAWKVGIYLLS